MHAGCIDRNTAAGRVYRALCQYTGEWWDAWNLMHVAKAAALSTRISEIRAQLPQNQRIERDERTVEGQRRQFYRIVIVDKAEESAA